MENKQDTQSVEYVTLNQWIKSNPSVRLLLIVIIFTLFLTQVTIFLNYSIENSIFSSLISCSLTLMLCSVALYVLHDTLLKQHCQPIQDLLKRPTKSTNYIYRAYETISLSFTPAPKEKDTETKDKPAPKAKRIDSKYFKPKFIYQELMSIWGTTYTVITWGSVWVVGGTIVATERLAQKIKTKCSKDQPQHNPDTSGCFERNYSFTSNASSSSSSSSASNTNKSPMKRLSSWTRRSYASAKKKINKMFNAGTLQIMNSTISSKTSQ